MKIGIIFCAFDCEDLIEKSLTPWIEASSVIDDIAEIGVVSVPFKDFEPRDNQKTVAKIQNMLFSAPEKVKSFLLSQNEPVTEAEARNMPLQYFLEKEFDLIWMVDADEYYSLQEIKNIIKFVENNPLTAWFSINFKNYIFNDKTWIDGFRPPRIFRTSCDCFTLKEFYWDNDLNYEHRIVKDRPVAYTQLPSQNVPKALAQVTHITWLSDERSKRKVEYQKKHFGDCSFDWSEENNKLIFNPLYFLKHGAPLPIVNKDE